MNPVIRTDGLVILTKLPRGPRKGELDFSGDEQARSFNADWLLNYKKAFVLISSERGFTNTKKNDTGSGTIAAPGTKAARSSGGSDRRRDINELNNSASPGIKRTGK